MADFDREKYLSIGYLSRGRDVAKVREYRTDDGMVKETTDTLGNVVTERPGDRQDVTINAPVAHLTSNGG